MRSLATIAACLCLFVGSSSMTYAAKGPSKALASLAWNGVHSQFQTNYWLAIQLLRHEAKANFGAPAVQLRIQWNASSLRRLAKAYTYYINALQKQFPGQQTTWTRLALWNKNMRATAKKLGMEALAGEKSKGWMKRLRALEKSIPTKAPNLPKLATKPTHFGELLKAISGMGAGVEILSYYRLFQSIGALKQLKKPTKASLAPLSALGQHINGHRIMFKNLRKGLPSAKWTGLFSYHLALLYRCTMLSGALLLSKGSKKKKLQVRFQKRSQQLKSSMKKANPSLKKFWRL